MKKINVAVIFGGVSSEHKVSIISAQNVMMSLNTDKYTVLPVYISETGEWFLYDGNITNIDKVNIEKISAKVILSPDTSHKGLIRIVSDKIKFIQVDVVFPVLHGKNGEDGTIQGLLELSQIPYVGCGVVTSSVCMDKAFTKIVANSIGLKQVPYIIANKNDDVEDIVAKSNKELKYPVFVKPANAGSSVGVNKAKNKKELVKAIEIARAQDNKVIIEKAVVARELECAVIGNTGDNVTASVVGEVVSATDFYDFDSKYNNAESKGIIPDDISDEVKDYIKTWAVKLYEAVEGRGLSRVDFFFDESGEIYFNEINTMPGFTPISMYPKMKECDGLSYGELLDTLIGLAME